MQKVGRYRFFLCYYSYMNALEIERKFLLRPCSVKKFLKRHGYGYEAVPMEQFYLRSDAGGSERYRRAGERYIHTLKSAARGLVRDEREEEVDAETYRHFRARAASGLIEKVRYRVRVGRLLFELDEFRGALKGLVFLEVEFGSVEAAESFRVPAPFDRLLIADVSENPAFTNGALARTMCLPTLSESPEAILERIARKRDFLKASVSVEFGPYESLGNALRGILYSLMRTVRANREAILQDDEDPERLHQLRVAMRKMRVLLGLFPEAFASEWLDRRRGELSHLMHATGAARDLDVALAQIPRYREQMPRKCRGVIDRLGERLARKRSAAQERLRRALKSGEFTEALNALERLAAGVSEEGWGEAASQPVLPAVAPVLRRRFKKVRKAGKKLGTDTPEEAYHRQRIRVKKLRYLTEFFAAVLDREATEEMTARLKEIQTVLGEHQDLAVQREWIGEWMQEEFPEPPERRCLKRLRRRLGEEAGKRRELFGKKFGAFARSGELLRRMICRD